jgi:DNA helicase HerA-like ATPase
MVYGRAGREMRILLGDGKFADKEGRTPRIVWDSEKVINGHMMIVGASGTGKTFRLRCLMDEMLRQKPSCRFFVIDVHGDIVIPGASVVRFSETTDYGLNPLKVSDDKDFGGVRKRVRSFISTLRRTSHALGSKQEATLINLLNDLYRANGFVPEDPRTWAVGFDARPGRRMPKKQPTITDLKRFAEYKLKQMVVGAGSQAVGKLEQLHRKFRSLDRMNARAHADDDVDLTALKAEVKKLYGEYVDAIETGRELDDVIKYNSRDVIQSVFERVVTLESSGIFKASPPPFDQSASIWNYDIRSLNKDEQQMFVDVLLEDLFMEAKARGERSEPDTFIVIDEAHKFVSEEDEHIVNVIAKEARKFGVGLILASQSLSHFPEDVIANCSTKMILGLDEMYHDVAARRLRIEPKRFSYIQPHVSSIVQVKTKGSLQNRFVDVNLPRTADPRS